MSGPYLVAPDAVIPVQDRPAITDRLPYLLAGERLHLNRIHRRVGHLAERFEAGAPKPGNSWDRKELDALQWAIGVIETVVAARTEPPLTVGCPGQQ